MDDQARRQVIPGRRKPWYRILYLQVLIAILIGGLLGWLAPQIATNDWVKALGDGFIKLIRMMIAFASGDILQVLFFSVLFGFALMALGERRAMVRSFIDEASQAVFGVIAIVLCIEEVFGWIKGSAGFSTTPITAKSAKTTIVP